LCSSKDLEEEKESHSELDGGLYNNRSAVEINFSLDSLDELGDNQAPPELKIQNLKNCKKVYLMNRGEFSKIF